MKKFAEVLLKILVSIIMFPVVLVFCALIGICSLVGCIFVLPFDALISMWKDD